jgi:hypothetical protein
MTSIVLNDESSRTPIGELLASASDAVIEIKNEQGAVVAEIILHHGPDNISAAAMAWAESEVDELRRRQRADRSKDVTTAELLKLAEERLAEQRP